MSSGKIRSTTYPDKHVYISNVFTPDDILLKLLLLEPNVIISLSSTYLAHGRGFLSTYSQQYYQAVLCLHECYSLDTGPLRRVPKDIKDHFQASGIDLDCFMFVDVRNKGSGKDSDAIYSNWFNGKDGVIVFHENYRGRDSDPPSLWPSEAIWQSFVMVADKEQTSPSDLRYGMRHSVKNEREW